LQVAERLNTPPPSGKAEAQASQTVRTRFPANVNVKSLPAIITNLAAPERAWIRLEASLVMENEQSAEANALAGAIVEDIVAFLRTVSLRQLQGASGYQHLREDLNDRVRMRGGGKVRDLLIQNLVVE
jgi:flagellar FliL protein